MLSVSVTSHALLCLEGFDSLVSYTPSGPYILSASPIPGFPEPWGNNLMYTACLELSGARCYNLCILSNCGSLYLFPFAEEGCFSDDGSTMYATMSIEE